MLDIQTIILLLSKGDTNYTSILPLLLVPVIIEALKYLFNHLKDYITVKRINYANNVYSLKYYSVITTGYLSNIKFDLTFSYVAYYLSKLDKRVKIVYHDNDRFYLDKCNNLYVTNDIYIDVFISVLDKSNENTTKNIDTTRIEMVIKSKTKNIKELMTFVEKCKNEYDLLKTSKKLYHFTYVKSNDNNDTLRLTFNVNCISDLSDPSKTNNESFEFIHHNHKQKIMNDMIRLRDHEYYQKNGLKRKKGYLFYGNTGTGKTSTVSAMSNFDQRHILEVPLSRVKSNRELENILNLTEINGIPITNDKLIILFDEIDRNSKIINKEKTDDSVKDCKEHAIMSLLTNKEEHKNMRFEEDPLNMGMILSKLDGIGNYNGLIIVATTNFKEKLDPALYRFGRLDPLFYDYISKKDCQDMIEQFYKCKLSNEQIECLPTTEKHISHSAIRSYIDTYSSHLGELLDYLKTL